MRTWQSPGEGTSTFSEIKDKNRGEIVGLQMVTSISRPTSHVFLGRGRQGEGCIQRKEQSDYHVGDPNTGKKIVRGHLSAPAVTDRLTNIAKDITAFPTVMGIPPEILSRTGLWGARTMLYQQGSEERGQEEYVQKKAENNAIAKSSEAGCGEVALRSQQDCRRRLTF